MIWTRWKQVWPLAFRIYGVSHCKERRIGIKYLGMRAFCLERGEEMVFRIDRIPEIKEA